MTPDWGQVTQGHVRQACELHDSGTALPKRSAKSTFLLLNGKTYPAKFIRGLAYRLATGIELNPNLDYSGGVETIRFFERLGFVTRHDPSTNPDELTVAIVPLPVVDEPPSVPREIREPQKRALAELLRRRFCAIQTEAQFPWLTIPYPDQMDETIRTIFIALKEMRGFTEFITPGKSLRCDFFVPSEKLIVEYDERQHFTLQRAKTIELYPAGLNLGFDREQWIAACQAIRATDPRPPHRDEQRAFYDSLRDILAARNGVRLIRLRFGIDDWTGSGSGTVERLDGILGDRSLASAPSTKLTAPALSGNVLNSINKVAVVSHDYNLADSGGRHDYSEHFSRINRLSDEQGCDTILYALYTWDRDSPEPRNHDAFFKGLTHVQRLILEVGQPTIESFDHVEVWHRGQDCPQIVTQRFATSSASGSEKQAFLDDLAQRQVQDSLLVLCGETNIASLVRGSDEFYDPYSFADRLAEMKVRLVFNPVHDYMRRYEMREKRRYYSGSGRTVISVWNQGKGKEAHLPWNVFHDGLERTEDVAELSMPFEDRPDIRIGILDLSRLA
jgi:hypothetical protein